MPDSRWHPLAGMCEHVVLKGNETMYLFLLYIALLMAGLSFIAYNSGFWAGYKAGAEQAKRDLK